MKPPGTRQYFSSAWTASQPHSRYFGSFVSRHITKYDSNVWKENILPGNLANGLCLHRRESREKRTKNRIFQLSLWHRNAEILSFVQSFLHLAIYNRRLDTTQFTHVFQKFNKYLYLYQFNNKKTIIKNDKKNEILSRFNYKEREHHSLYLTISRGLIETKWNLPDIWNDRP